MQLETEVEELRRSGIKAEAVWKAKRAELEEEAGRARAAEAGRLGQLEGAQAELSAALEAAHALRSQKAALFADLEPLKVPPYTLMLWDWKD